MLFALCKGEIIIKKIGLLVKRIKSLWKFPFDSSVVILDVGGGYLRDTTRAFHGKGYKIKVLNLIAPQKSLLYNPFAYLKRDDDVFALTQTIINSSQNEFAEEFWECCEACLLASMTLYVCHKQPKERQNFITAINFLNKIKYGDVALDDEMLGQMPSLEPGVFTRVLDGLIDRLRNLSVSPIREIIQEDTLDLDAFCHQKTVLFVVLPSSDQKFDCFIDMLLDQSQRCCSNIKIIDSR